MHSASDYSPIMGTPKMVPLILGNPPYTYIYIYIINFGKHLSDSIMTGESNQIMAVEVAVVEHQEATQS